MSESIIRADAPVVTLINVFTVDPVDQQRLRRALATRHRRGDAPPAGLRLRERAPQPRRHESRQLRPMGKSAGIHRDAPEPRRPTLPNRAIRDRDPRLPSCARSYPYITSEQRLPPKPSTCTHALVSGERLQTPALA